jgi:hypothetical protein
MIDDVISTINSVQWNLDDEHESDLNERFIQILGVMEDIRSANSTLREWGNELYVEKTDLEKERDELLSRVTQLEDEVFHLEKSLDQEYGH